MSDNTWVPIVAVVPLAVGVLLSAYEIVRRPDLGLIRKVLWLVLLIMFPPIVLGLYVVARPPRHRAAVSAAAPGTDRAAAIVDLVERHVSGDVDDAEYLDELESLRTSSS